MESAAGAGDALTRYRQAVTKSGKDVKDVTGVGDGGFAGKDSFYGNLVAIRAGHHVAVALGVTSEDAGKTQLAGLVRNIK